MKQTFSGMDRNKYICADDPCNECPSLIELPIADLKKTGTSLEATCRNGTGKNEKRTATLPKLMLMELPNDLSLEQLVATKSKIMSTKIVNGENQARLVTERDGSYNIIKVETSNALIMVPPIEKDSTKSKLNHDVRNKKRPREKELVSMPARKADSSFMELHRVHIDKSQLNEILASTSLYDPYNSNHQNAYDSSSFGLTLSELSAKVCVSQKEVYEALESMEVFRSCSDYANARYFIISEEATQDCCDAIISSLVEKEINIQHSTVGSLVDASMAMLEEQSSSHVERMHDARSMISHSLHLLRRGVFQYDDHFSNESNLNLDANKLARSVAHQIFHSKSEPWCQETFFSEWIRRMPEVEESFVPSLELLKGIAINEEILDEDTQKLFLKYVPEKKLPLRVSDRFEILFKLRSKWARADLEPYLSTIIEKSDNSLSEVLLLHTRVVTHNGKKWHIKK